MTSYFSRLLASQQNFSANSVIQPVNQSKSPVAEFDQRLGAEGIAPVDTQTSMSGSNVDLSNAHRNPSIQEISRTPSVSPSIQRKLSTSSNSQNVVDGNFQVATNKSTAFPTNSNNKVEDVDGLGASLASQKMKPSARSHSNKTNSSVIGSNSLSQLSGQESESIVFPENTSYQRNRVDEDSNQVTSENPSNVDSLNTISTEATKTAVLLPQENLDILAKIPLQGFCNNSTGQNTSTPSVTINQMNIEVIQAPSAQPNSQSSNQHPMTAAGVSVIGSLSRQGNARLRLNLKRR